MCSRDKFGSRRDDVMLNPRGSCCLPELQSPGLSADIPTTGKSTKRPRCLRWGERERKDEGVGGNSGGRQYQSELSESGSLLFFNFSFLVRSGHWQRLKQLHLTCILAYLFPSKEKGFFSFFSFKYIDLRERERERERNTDPPTHAFTG